MSIHEELANKQLDLEKKLGLSGSFNVEGYKKAYASGYVLRSRNKLTAEHSGSLAVCGVAGRDRVVTVFIDDNEPPFVWYAVRTVDGKNALVSEKCPATLAVYEG